MNMSPEPAQASTKTGRLTREQLRKMHTASVFLGEPGEQVAKQLIAEIETLWQERDNLAQTVYDEQALRINYEGTVDRLMKELNDLKLTLSERRNEIDGLDKYASSIELKHMKERNAWEALRQEVLIACAGHEPDCLGYGERPCDCIRGIVRELLEEK